MSKWAGKFVIGLTGNIATGKSVTRKMLEHLGAYGIDADALAHRAIARGAPGYQPIVETFGRWILTEEGQIDRAKLGRIVFSDPEALLRLENIVHPLVAQATDVIVRRAPQSYIVIEAIKLIESNLINDCDSIWVTYATSEIQLTRLMEKRKMSEAEARLRIESQPPQERKLAMANVVIKNVGSYEDTWRQVSSAWDKYIVKLDENDSSAPTAPAVELKSAKLQMERGKPKHSREIADLINRLKEPQISLTEEDIMAAFGEKAFLLLRSGGDLIGAIGWQVENLIARTTEIYLDKALSIEETLPILIEEMEASSKALQSEASLIFAPDELAGKEELWQSLGYEKRLPEQLGVLAWQEAVKESFVSGATLYFKQLRLDRVLRPL